MFKRLLRCALGLCLVFCLSLVLAGCMQPTSNTNQNDSVSANRQYMSSVNQAVSELSDRLQGFEDAVSRGDAVTMRTQADDAFKALDVLSTIEVPDDMKELNEGYQQACDKLEEALDEYVEVYSEISSSKDGFDVASVQGKIDEIQSKYNEGIDLLESTDKKATELQK